MLPGGRVTPSGRGRMLTCALLALTCNAPWLPKYTPCRYTLHPSACLLNEDAVVPGEGIKPFILSTRTQTQITHSSESTSLGYDNTEDGFLCVRYILPTHPTPLLSLVLTPCLLWLLPQTSSLFQCEGDSGASLENRCVFLKHVFVIKEQNVN